MRTVQVYIEGQRLDLFNDETISVTSKQQDVQDISKVLPTSVNRLVFRVHQVMTQSFNTFTKTT